MPQQNKFSDHLDTLVALVTYLAMTRHKSRTPKRLARELSLDPDKVIYVLENFKGLFRKSQRKTDDSDEHYYSLQLRYARRWIEEGAGDDEDDPDPKAPLEAEYLSTLLSFISSQAEQEQAYRRQKSSNIATMIGAWIAAFAAILAAIFSFFQQ
jgi:hypothetical protein